MATDEVILHLPDDLYRRITRLSHLTGNPVEGIIVRMLTSNLPPLPEDFTPHTREALQSLEALSDDQLTAFSTAQIPAKEYARLTVLRDRRREGVITPDEQPELEALLQAADTLTLQKAYAAVLLKWRGQSRGPRVWGTGARPEA